MANLPYRSRAAKRIIRMCRLTLVVVPLERCSPWHSICLVGEVISYLQMCVTLFLVKRQDVFGGVGQPESLIDKLVDFDSAAESYRAFEKGEVGKIIFDPWK
jgi:hypothetical protein